VSSGAGEKNLKVKTKTENLKPFSSQDALVKNIKKTFSIATKARRHKTFFITDYADYAE